MFMACTCVLTDATHIENITVTGSLIREGTVVPAYFQVGFCPSAEMAACELAWAFWRASARRDPRVAVSEK